MKLEKVLIIYNPSGQGVDGAVEKLKGLLGQKGALVTVGTGSWGLEEKPDCSDISYDLVVALGGDGTFLAASRVGAPQNAPILGINLGTRGFLADTDPGDMEKCLDMIEADDFTLIERMMLSTYWHDENGLDYKLLPDCWGGEKMGPRDENGLGKTISSNFKPGEKMGPRDENGLGNASKNATVLNDIVVYRSDNNMARLLVRINGVDLDYIIGDGIIFSSPTGSTAYSLSAGGPIIHPSLKGILLVPLAAHSLHSRPIIVSDKDEIQVIVQERSGFVCLSLDGIKTRELKEGQGIVVKASEKTAKTIKFESGDFFSILRKKLYWGAKSLS